MATQQVRLTDEAIGIIRSYAPTDSLSRGVLEMKRQLSFGTTSNAIVTGNVTTSTKDTVTISNTQSANQRWLEKSQVAVDGSIRLGDVSEKEYWKKMKIELDAIIQTYAGR